jgi:hypothetical protein
MVTDFNESSKQVEWESYRPGALAVFAGVACYLAVVQVLTISAGLARLVFSPALAVAIAMVALAVSVLFSTRFFERVFTPDQPAGHQPGRSARAVRLLSRLTGAAAVTWAAWVWLELWILAWLRPPYDWDGLYYHLPAIHEWADAGRVCFTGHMPNIPFVNFPMAVELNTFFAHHLLGTSRLVNACNLWYWPLAFLALVVIAGRLGARGVWRWAAGAMLAGVPVFVCQSVSCYIDPGFGAAVMASMAAVLVFVFGGGRSGWWNAALLGTVAGLALGAKGTGLPFAVVIVSVAAAGALWIRGFAAWKTVCKRAGVVVAFVVVVGGYWYARNMVLTGNPIFPIRLSIGEKIVIDGWDHDEFNNANLPDWLRERPAPIRMFVSWTQPDAPIYGYAPVGGMGYVWLAGGVPAILLLWIGYLRRRSVPGGRTLVVLTVLALALLAVQPAAWWSRFTVWLHALGLPCLAVVMSRAVYGWRSNPWHLAAMVFVAGVCAVAVWETGRTLRLEWAEGSVSEPAGLRTRYKSSVDYMFPGLAKSDGFDRFFAADNVARSPWDSHATLLGGVLAMPLGRRSISVLPHQPGEADLEKLRASGVEWVLWDVTHAGDVPVVLADEAAETWTYEVSPLKFTLLRILP